MCTRKSKFGNFIDDDIDYFKDKKQLFRSNDDIDNITYLVASSLEIRDDIAESQNNG
jgi:hypothetical protein